MSRNIELETRRKQRVRRALRARAFGRPRLSVFRSSKQIYAQIIDDEKGVTLVSASSLEKDNREKLKSGANIEAAKAVGKLHKTASGALMGKLRYMSPEQITGEPLDGILRMRW